VLHSHFEVLLSSSSLDLYTTVLVVYVMMDRQNKLKSETVLTTLRHGGL
jgi:hypothetical protein